MVYEVTESDYTKIKEWEKFLPKKWQRIPNKYCFSSCAGIGLSFVVRKEKGLFCKELDLTDMSKW